MTNENRDLRAQARVDLAREAVFFLGTTEVRPATRQVTGASGEDVIEPRVMQVLVALARAKGEIVTRDDLILACWEGRVVSEDAINRVISRLRRLSETAGGFQLETITKVGCRLLAGRSEGASGAPPPPTPTPTTSAPRWRQHRGATVGALVALVAAAAAFVWFSTQHAPPRRLAMVALLPFETAADADSRYLADGLGVSLAQTLDQTGILVAITPDEAAARRANATFIVGGDVRRDGAMLHVTVRVEDAAHDLLLLTKSFDGTTAQTAALRDRIAADIAGSGITWRSDQPPEVTVALFRIREKLNANDRLGAYEIARTMLENSPNSAIAQMQFAGVSAYALRALPAAERQRAVVIARAAARRGHALDPRLGDYWTTSAFLLPIVNWSETEATLRHATDDPHDTSFAPSYLGSLFRNSGHLREARVQIERGVARDPTSPDKQGDLIDILVMLGENAQANTLLDRDARLWPYHYELTHGRFDTAISHNNLAEADALLRDTIAGPQLEPRDAPQLMHLIVSALRTHSARDMTALATQCAHADTISRGTARNCLVALTHLGQLDAAFTLAAGMYPDQRAPTREAEERRWLETQGALHAAAVMFYPDMAPLRADPRFAGIVDGLGLVAYWRESRHPPDFCATEHAPVCAQLR